MALNITFDGFCSLNDGTLSNINVQYQAFFYPINAGSSAAKWNDVRTVEASGYWNCNLGDGTWLGQDGSAAINDRVIIVFWRGGPRMGSDCSVLAEWGAFTITLDGSDTYTNPTQVRENILPDLLWDFPDPVQVDYYVDINYDATNNSVDAAPYPTHLWTWSGTEMGHYQLWADGGNEPIYLVNYVKLSHYDWDDGNQDNNLGGAANGIHSWSSPGDYTVQLVIEDHCGDTVTGTKDIRIKYPPPTPDIIMIPSDPDPDTPVSFQWNGTDIYNTISGIDWIINDSGAYGNTDTGSNGHGRDDVVPHSSGQGTDWYGNTATPGAFTNPGSHLVEITYYWFDGFTTQTGTYSEPFTQKKFDGPTVDFYQDPDPVPVGSGVEFHNTTIDPDNRVGTSIVASGTEYDWAWDDDGNLDTVINVPYSYVYNNTPTTDNVSVELCTYWNDGWDDYTECKEKDVAIETTVVVTQEDCYYNLYIYGTSGDGTVSGYSWQVSRSTTSGIGGPYEVLWTSPTGTNQRSKTICFTEQNYFKIEGFVYGTGATTSGVEYILVDEVCPGAECALIIWNGTGILDSGGDWEHTSHGTEVAYAKYEGTKGLDATGFTSNKKKHFK
jgi:hypothetical protein